MQCDDYDAGIIDPAVSMVTALLEAAAQASSVARIVITSSCEHAAAFTGLDGQLRADQYMTGVTLIPFEWNADPDTERLYTGESPNSSLSHVHRRHADVSGSI